jgi:hypothetical protein
LIDQIPSSRRNTNQVPEISLSSARRIGLLNPNDEITKAKTMSLRDKFKMASKKIIISKEENFLTKVSL